MARMKKSSGGELGHCPVLELSSCWVTEVALEGVAGFQSSRAIKKRIQRALVEQTLTWQWIPPLQLLPACPLPVPELFWSSAVTVTLFGSTAEIWDPLCHCQTSLLWCAVTMTP